MSDTNYERQVFEHIEQWRAYLHSLSSPRLRPTPSLLCVQPIDPDLADETRALLLYQQQTYQKKHGLGRYASGEPAG